MLLKIAYLLTCHLLGLARLVLRGDLAKDAELLVLRFRLVALRRREDVLVAAQEATDTYRKLAATRPDAFRPNLARSLTNLSAGLGGLGRYEDALAAIEEVVTIRRELAAARPDAFRPDLVGTLHNPVDQPGRPRSERGRAGRAHGSRLHLTVAR